MSPRQIEILQHALGCDQYGQSARRRGGVFHRDYDPYSRNHFCAGTADEPDCRALVEMGFMKQHKTTEWLPYFNCSVTPAGIEAMRNESQAPPKISRAKMRYEEYLRADGCLGETFRDYLRTIQTPWYKDMKAGKTA